MHLVLVGLMGAGKTTVGRACADRLARPFVDVDEVVEAGARRSVREIFAVDGEGAFRALERTALADVCASPDPLVVACGGGAMVDPENRRRVRAAGCVVWLTADPVTLADRVGETGRTQRPLLAGGEPPLTTLARMAELHAPSYEGAAHVVVDTVGRTVGEVTDQVLEEFAAMPRLTVAVEPPYDVVVGADVLAGVARELGQRRCVAVVSQAAVLDAHGDTVMKALAESGARVLVTTIDDGEDAKSLTTVERLCRSWTVEGLLRSDAVVALGGGVVGDTAGFAAAVYHRGVAVLQCPTTLLAQVDAAIGGKTAVNLPEGKNLVGAFHQPVAVIADVATLATLPEREYRAGLGEVARSALMGGAADPDEIAATLVDRRDGVDARDPVVLTDLVTRSAAIKARVVGDDPEERTGLRATLNYGHTLTHALETVGHHDLHHGEAVGVGLVFVGALAAALERVPPSEVERHRDLVVGLGLPAEATGLAAGDLVDVMQRDKKARGGLSFVLLGPDGLETVEESADYTLAAAFRAVGIDA